MKFPQFLQIFFLLTILVSGLVESKTYLRATGAGATYQLINSIFGGESSAIEVPDCNHTVDHITQQFDTDYNNYVFAFHLHIKEDDDRCVKFDRQRNEIKTNDNLQITGHLNEFMTLSWNFKLDSKFQAPYGFCHIHQLKAVGGDDSMPILTITPRKSSPDELQLLQHDSKGALHFLTQVPLQPFLGRWIHASANVTFGFNGAYELRLDTMDTGENLLAYSSDNIDFWRNDTGFVRPKWGLYRSVQEAVLQRDETILFQNFCVGIGSDDVCT